MFVSYWFNLKCSRIVTTTFFTKFPQLTLGSFRLHHHVLEKYLSYSLWIWLQPLLGCMFDRNNVILFRRYNLGDIKFFHCCWEIQLWVNSLRLLRLLLFNYLLFLGHIPVYTQFLKSRQSQDPIWSWDGSYITIEW